MPAIIGWILKNIPLIIATIRELLALVKESDKDVRQTCVKEAKDGLLTRDTPRLRAMIKARREERQLKK
jgi:hypothetical protein